jgi:NitT/TauT family transport system permease protein
MAGVGTRGRLVAAALVAAALAAWELLARAGVVSPTFLPAPTIVLAALIESIAGGAMLDHLRLTMLRVAAGLTAGGIAGLIAGLAMGASPSVRAVADPFVAAVHPVPKLALLPLFMVFFGLGEQSKVLVVALAAFFPMLLNAMAGVRQISPAHFDVARAYGATRRQMLTRVLLPGSLPMVLTGVRLAANIAFLSAIAVEMVASSTGLGAQLWFSWQVLRVDLLYATIAVIAASGAALSAALRWLARRGAPWLSERELTI